MRTLTAGQSTEFALTDIAPVVTVDIIQKSPPTTLYRYANRAVFTGGNNYAAMIDLPTFRDGLDTPIFWGLAQASDVTLRIINTADLYDTLAALGTSVYYRFRVGTMAAGFSFLYLGDYEYKGGPAGREYATLRLQPLWPMAGELTKPQIKDWFSDAVFNRTAGMPLAYGDFENSPITASTKSSKILRLYVTGNAYLLGFNSNVSNGLGASGTLRGRTAVANTAQFLELTGVVGTFAIGNTLTGGLTVTDIEIVQTPVSEGYLSSQAKFVKALNYKQGEYVFNRAEYQYIEAAFIEAGSISQVTAIPTFSNFRGSALVVNGVGAGLISIYADRTSVYTPTEREGYLYIGIDPNFEILQYKLREVYPLSSLTPSARLTATISSGSLNATTADTSGLKIGYLVHGPGIQTETYIDDITSPTAFTLTKTAGISATVTLYFPMIFDVIGRALFGSSNALTHIAGTPLLLMNWYGVVTKDGASIIRAHAFTEEAVSLGVIKNQTYTNSALTTTEYGADWWLLEQTAGDVNAISTTQAIPEGRLTLFNAAGVAQGGLFYYKRIHIQSTYTSGLLRTADNYIYLNEASTVANILPGWYVQQQTGTFRAYFRQKAATPQYLGFGFNYASNFEANAGRSYIEAVLSNGETARLGFKPAVTDPPKNYVRCLFYLEMSQTSVTYSGYNSILGVSLDMGGFVNSTVPATAGHTTQKISIDLTAYISEVYKTYPLDKWVFNLKIYPSPAITPFTIRIYETKLVFVVEDTSEGFTLSERTLCVSGKMAKDDANGTFTGTANGSIEKAADVGYHFLNKIAGVPVSQIDTTSFAAVRNAARLLAFQELGGIDPKDFISRVLWHNSTVGRMSQDLKLKAFAIGTASGVSFTEAIMAADSYSVEYIDDVYGRVEVRYGYNPITGETTTASYGSSGEIWRPSWTLWVNSTAVAADILTALRKIMTARWRRASFETRLDTIKAEPGDAVTDFKLGASYLLEQEIRLDQPLAIRIRLQDDPNK